MYWKKSWTKGESECNKCITPKYLTKVSQKGILNGECHIKWDQENHELNEAVIDTHVHRSQSKDKARPFIFQPIYTPFRYLVYLLVAVLSKHDLTSGLLPQ